MYPHEESGSIFLCHYHTATIFLAFQLNSSNLSAFHVSTGSADPFLKHALSLYWQHLPVPKVMSQGVSQSQHPPRPASHRSPWVLEIAEGICTVQGLQTLVSSDPVANLPRRCCPAGLLLGQTAQRAVGRRAARSALGGGAGSGLAPQASSSACLGAREGPGPAAPVSVPGCVPSVPAPASRCRALLGLLLLLGLVPRTPQPAPRPHTRPRRSCEAALSKHCQPSPTSSSVFLIPFPSIFSFPGLPCYGSIRLQTNFY